MRGLACFHPSSSPFSYTHIHALYLDAYTCSAMLPQAPTCLPHPHKTPPKKTQLLSAGRNLAQAPRLSFSAPESEAELRPSGIQKRARRLDPAGRRQKRRSAGAKSYTETRSAAKFSFSALAASQRRRGNSASQLLSARSVAVSPGKFSFSASQGWALAAPFPPALFCSMI